MSELIQIMDEMTATRILTRITHEILERNNGASTVCLLGIQSRGIEIANILKNNIMKFAGVEVPLGVLDATNYRDDISDEVKKNHIDMTNIEFDVNNKDIILVDDVLYTGRTIRASIEALFALGRPNSVQLAVLIDRGHRELPIRPDFIGKNLPTSKLERVMVKVQPSGNVTGVFISK